MTPQIKEQKHDNPRVEYPHAIETKPQKPHRSTRERHELSHKTTYLRQDPLFEELREELGL